jgi:hypothetical protein
MTALVVWFAVAASLVAGTIDAPLVQERGGIQSAAWLQGCWETKSDARSIEERWMPPRGDSMLGVGRTVRAGRMVEYELIVLREQEGHLMYEAHPAGQPAATFQLAMEADGLLVFENAAHDFPQRIGYRREGPEILVAWIEGTADGKPRRVEFRYTRAACDSR